jgi:hypothetical protein
MKHLGGSGKMNLCWVVQRSHLWRSCVSHLWMATQEQRDWRRSSREASSATTSHIVFTWPFEQNEHHGKKGWLSLVGKVHDLCRVLKTKYLAVSLVTDNFERHDFETVQGSPHANFLKLKFVGWTGNMAIGANVYRLAGPVPFLCASVCRDRSPKPSCLYVVIEDLTFDVTVYRQCVPYDNYDLWLQGYVTQVKLSSISFALRK